ncbi:MAG: NAD(P)/FAD-dependent oxidoreductase [Chlamydiales bacterium]
MGLTLGYLLSQHGFKVHILEKQPQIGGLSTWFDYEEFIWDKYYHVILKSDAHLIKLIDELGLRDKLYWKATKTGFLWKGQHLSMSNYREFLRFPVLNLFQKFRLGSGILYSRYFSDPERLESIPAHQWLSKVFGKKVYHAIWEPLLESKFGVLKDKVPATIIASTLNRYYSTRSKGEGMEHMGHLWGEGLKSLLKALENKIVLNGGIIECAIQVNEVKTESNKVKVLTETHSFEFDGLISTLPNVFLKKLASNVRFISQRDSVPEFLGVIRLALVLDKPLSPYYVTNLIDRGLPYTGIIEVSALTDPKELEGWHLVMIPRYDVPSSLWFQKSDREIYDTFISSLKKTWPDIESSIAHHFVHREKIVQALWIETPPSCQEPTRSEDHKIWSINAELAGRDTLNNNALVGVAYNIKNTLLEAFSS